MESETRAGGDSDIRYRHCVRLCEVDSSFRFGGHDQSFAVLLSISLEKHPFLFVENIFQIVSDRE